MAHQKLPVLFDLIILAAERNDFRRRLLSRRAHQPVGVQAAASDDKLRLEVTGGSFHRPAAGGLNKFLDARVEFDFAAGLADEFAEFLADARIIHDAFLRHVNRRDAGGVRLDFLDLLRIQFPQALQAVGISAFPQIFQTRQFVLGRGDDDFPALFVRDAVRPAEGEHLLQTLHGAFRLFRAGFVIKSRMQHAAVVAGLVRGQLGFLFQQQQFQLRPRFEQPVSGGEADNAAAHNRHVVGHVT